MTPPHLTAVSTQVLMIYRRLQQQQQCYKRLFTKITNNVLSELNSRAQQLLGSPYHDWNNYSNGDSSSNKVMNRRNKRYSTIHMNKFTNGFYKSALFGSYENPSPQKSESPSSGRWRNRQPKKKNIEWI